MSRSAEAWQECQDQIEQADMDDCLCCEFQENMSGCQGMTYTHCEPLKQQEIEDGKK